MSDSAKDFEDAYDSMLQSSYQVAYRLLGERAAAEDVAAEALARASSRWSSVSGHAQPWVVTVATDLALAVGRKRDRAERPRFELTEEEMVDAVELRPDLQEALRALPRRQREVVALRFLADYTEQATAAALAIDIGTVKSDAAHAVSRLRNDEGGAPTTFQHLDDPTPLPPSTPAQRQATRHQGVSVQRRRRARTFAVAVAAVITLVAMLALPPLLRGDTVTVDPPVAVSSVPSTPAAQPSGPGRGTAIFWDASPLVSATFTLPAGWITEDGAVYNPNDSEPIGFAFFDVTNIYTDGCRWRMVSPEPGPTVGDLVSAFAKVPGTKDAVRDVVVDGWRGKLVNYMVPDYNEDKCIEGMFGIVKSDGKVGSEPNMWAASPDDEYQIRILDVDGTRLVIISNCPPGTSAEGRRSVDTILSSVRIG